jgi:hypothetical protein
MVALPECAGGFAFLPEIGRCLDVFDFGNGPSCLRVGDHTVPLYTFPTD